MIQLVTIYGGGKVLVTDEIKMGDRFVYKQNGEWVVSLNQLRPWSESFYRTSNIKSIIMFIK